MQSARRMVAVGVVAGALLGCGPSREVERQAEVREAPAAEPPDRRSRILTHALGGHPSARVESAQWETPLTHFGMSRTRLLHLVAHDGAHTIDAWVDEETPPVWALAHAADVVREGPITAWHGRVVQLEGRWLWCPTSRDACAVLPAAQSIHASSTDSPDEGWAVAALSPSRTETWALTWEEGGPTLQRLERYATGDEVGPRPTAERLHGRATGLRTAPMPRAVRALDAVMREEPCALDVAMVQRDGASVRAISCRIDDGGGYGLAIPALLYDVEAGETHFQTPQHRARSGYALEALIATSPHIIIESRSDHAMEPTSLSRADLVAVSSTHLHTLARQASDTDNQPGGSSETAFAARALRIAATPEGLRIEGCESYTGVAPVAGCVVNANERRSTSRCTSMRSAGSRSQARMKRTFRRHARCARRFDRKRLRDAATQRPR